MNKIALVATVAALLCVVLAMALTNKFKDLTEARRQAVRESNTQEVIDRAKGLKPPKDIYRTQEPTPDGIGKVYMGREIAQVMGHQAIRWLERPDREKEESPSLVFSALDLKPNATIADIGAGSGYYTFRLAPLVPQGRVVAIDIQPEMIRFLENKEKELGLTNVSAHLGTIEDIKLPPNSLDAAIMVDAYHEFSHPWEMMTSLVSALKPRGRVYLLEYRTEDPDVPIKPLHKMTQEQAKKEMAAVGLKWIKTEDFLPWQHLMIFEKTR